MMGLMMMMMMMMALMRTTDDGSGLPLSASECLLHKVRQRDEAFHDCL